MSKLLRSLAQNQHMPATHYNPCTDGFPAKAWECLRRNKEFLDAQNYYGAKDQTGIADAKAKIISFLDRDRGSYRFSAYDQIGGLFFSAIFRRTLNLKDSYEEFYEDDFIDSSFCNDDPPDDVSKSWPQLQDDTKHEILKAFDVNQRTKTYNYECSDIPKIWDRRHKIIGVPLYVRDCKHKKEILEEVAELLGEPAGNRKCLKPTGSTLGTSKEWSTFLDYEEWTRLGFERKDAANLAAERKRVIKAEHPLYGDKIIHECDDKRIKAAKNFLKLNIAHPHVTRAEMRINNIEKSIASVFPSFSLFSSK